MDFSKLIGQIFQENALYETLQFELEENSESYFGKYLHIYFTDLVGGQIQVMELVYFETVALYHEANKAMLGKKGFFRIYDNCGHIDLMLCRMNTSGKLSIALGDRTFVQEFSSKSFDYPVLDRPMTKEEIRMAFQELAGTLDFHQAPQESKPKKAM